MYTLDLGSSGNSPRFLVTDGITSGASAVATSAGTVLALNQWYHIAGTYNGTQIALYLNGTLLATAPVNFSIGTNSMPLCLGGRLGSNTLNGNLSDVRIYESSLSAEQIQTLYTQGRVASINANLTGLWRLDDYAAASTADSSENKYTATLINAPVWGQSWADEDFILMNAKTQAMQIPSAAIKPAAGTIAAWICPASETGVQYLFGHVYNSSNRIALLTVNGKLGVSLGSESLIQQNLAVLPNNQMTHVALTWDNGQYAVHVDGEQKAVGTYSGLTQLRSTFDVGNYGDPALRIVGFLGLIDEVRIYGRALAADEIKNLFQTYEVKENRQVAFIVSGVDEQGNAISYSASNLPAGAVFNKKTQSFSWRPWYRQAGEYNMTFDAAGQPSENITVTVQEVDLQDWYREFLEANGKL